MFQRLLATAVVLASFIPAAAFATCGDGVLDSTEECDDLNTDNDDGCSDSCLIENGWTCQAATFDLDFDEIIVSDSTHDPPQWQQWIEDNTGTWVPTTSDGLRVTQEVNAQAAVYVSTLPAAGVTITFNITCNDVYDPNSGWGSNPDNDFMGWVVGYEQGDNQNPNSEWLLFDWKKEDQSLSGTQGEEGLRMSRVQGVVNSWRDVWGHQGSVTELATANTLGDTGWVEEITYQVEISYSTTQVDVSIDGILEFSETGSFPIGNFGFYNYSQEAIVYTLVAPTDQSICSMADSDSDGILDLDEFDLQTDPNNPDSDGDGIDDLAEVVDVQSAQDSDGDGTIDALDTDDDGDGVATIDEDLGNNGDPTDDDTDGDGTPNYLDTDDDGDGLLTYAEDADGDGDPTNDDTDTDSTPNYLDLDSDGDGSADNLDCQPLDPVIYPGATELCNGLDDDCNSSTFADAAGEVDIDTDLSLSCVDCDDNDPLNTPGGIELCDGQDNDCNQLDDYLNPGVGGQEIDGDGDGVVACADCDDSNAANFPGNIEFCDGFDNDCNGSADFDPTYGEFDTDGDGVLRCAECDDGDADNYPGNAETCDNQDNDCDGIVDENDAIDASTWHRDEDEDGYGNPTLTTVACTLPSGYVGDDSDCDDQDDNVNVDGTELCDGIDNDCNDAVDEPEALDSTTWYRDQDGDDYGDPETSTLSCSRPSGYVDENTDCDDTNSEVNPGMDEVWYDGIDQNCDGNDDDQDADGFNNEDDCNDEDAAINPGMSEVWYDGTDQDCDGNDDDQDYDQFNVEEDCDDTNAEVNPAAQEQWYDGIDQDCDGNDDDQDRDGFGFDEDCDDLNPELSWRCVADGCGCSAADSDPRTSLSLLSVLVMLGALRRRRQLA